MDTNKILEGLNFEEAKQYIGGVVFVTIIMVIGIIGNAHVLFIYAFRTKQSNHRIFILSLGVVDMITCLIGMSFIIVDLRNPLTFTMIPACKILRFVNYFVCISSGNILIVIAVDRYRKICVPLGKQISQRNAKILCLLCLVEAVLLSWPAPVLYGHSTVNTTYPNITGVRCFTEDKFLHTRYQAYFNAVLFLVVVIVFVILVVLYSLIARVIFKHTNAKLAIPVANLDSKNQSIDITDDCCYDEKDTNLKENNVIRKAENVNGNLKIATESLESPKKQNNRFNAHRTTFMFFLITTFFFLSYFPHLVLKIIAVVDINFVPNLNFSGKILYNTFVWCFFINNVTNCFVYGFCDLRFRKEIKQFYNRLFCRN